jgi:hypothetical protein
MAKYLPEINYTLDGLGGVKSEGGSAHVATATSLLPRRQGSNRRRRSYSADRRAADRRSASGRGEADNIPIAWEPILEWRRR